MKIVITRKEIKAFQSYNNEIEQIVNTIGGNSIGASMPSKTEILLKGGVIYSGPIGSIKITLKGDLKINVEEEFISDIFTAYAEMIKAAVPHAVAMITSFQLMQAAVQAKAETIGSELDKKWK